MTLQSINRSYFTLVEILIAVSLSTIIVAMIALVLIDGNETYKAIEADLALAHHSRLAREKIVRSGKLVSASWDELSTDGTGSNAQMKYQYYTNDGLTDLSTKPTISIVNDLLSHTQVPGIHRNNVMVQTPVGDGAPKIEMRENNDAMFNFGREAYISVWLKFTNGKRTYHAEQIIRTPVFNN